jgi:hypothetical protein
VHTMIHQFNDKTRPSQIVSLAVSAFDYNLDGAVAPLTCAQIIPASSMLSCDRVPFAYSVDSSMAFQQI